MEQQKVLKQIGQYQFNERHCLGEGAYGKVFQGTNIKTGETVAIKKLDLVLFERDQYLRNQIVQEIEILKKFNHPNIVKFCDLITTQRSLYIMTELCKDGDLKEVLLKKRLTENEAWQIMGQIVNGFKELIKFGVIHRDLKPANILNNDGIVKIADFGFARYVENYSSQLLRSCVGSPLYMAPQVLQRKSYSTKCDIWSLGIIMYEMIFHEVPWKGRDEQDLLRNILVKPLSFKQTVTYSPETEQFLKKALCVDESQRLQWDDVFAIFDARVPKTLPENELKISFHDISEERETVQKIPNWIGQQIVTFEVFQNKMKILVSERQGVAFKHFVNVELSMKLEMIKLYVRKELSLIEFVLLLSKSVLAASNHFIQQCVELCDSAESILSCGTKWNILNQLKKEHIFYQAHFEELKDNFYTDQVTEEFKSFYSEDDLNELALNKLHDLIVRRGQILVTEITDELQKGTRKSSNKECMDVGIIADYIIDLVMVRKRLVKSQEIDYYQIHLEKSRDGDTKKLIDRTLKKLKLSNTI